MMISMPMMSRTVGQLVAERPDRGRLFEQLGIDYCCGGKRTLLDACIQQGLDPEGVHIQLRAIDENASPAPGPDWSTAPLAQLADHIETAHHDLMRRELPRLAALVEKVARVHGSAHPELVELERTFGEFSCDLVSHMSKEETVVFPWIRALEGGRVGESPGCGCLDQPVRCMIEEHDDAGRALARMRELTSGFTPPSDACGTYRVMLAGLANLEADMHIHVHKENNILFPRALAMQSGRTVSPTAAADAVA